MTNANTAQADYWNGGAGQTWVEINRLLDMELQPLGLEAQAALAPRPGERLLDIGCGAGDTSLDLAKAVSPGGLVLGVDISRLLLDLAARRAEEAGLKVRFEAADAQVSDFGGERFDAAFSRFGVMFFADPPAALNGAVISGFSAGGRQQTKAIRPPGLSALRILAKAAAGSAKNITPKRENAASNRSPPKSAIWASAASKRA